jgi:hypothetical protein
MVANVPPGGPRVLRTPNLKGRSRILSRDPKRAEPFLYTLGDTKPSK